MDEATSAIINTKVQELWLNVDTNRSYILRGGKSAETDCMGHPLKRFIPYCTGTATLKHRREFAGSLKTASLRSCRSKEVHRLSPAVSILNTTIATPFYRPTVDKLCGYAMFPRPLSLPYCNVHTKSPTIFRIKPRDKSKTTLFLSPKNTTYSTQIQSCSFFTPKQQRSARCRSPARHSTIPDMSLEDSRQFLKPRQTLHDSFIKAKYFPVLKATFSPGSHLRKSSEDTMGMSAPDESRRRCDRSFSAIQEELKRQKAEITGFFEGKVKEVPISFKGVYSVKVPTEGELYDKARVWRRRTNPGAAKKEQGIIERDKFLFAKRRGQNELKYKAMRSTVRRQIG